MELTESFLANIAGWEVVKHAKAMLQGGRVLSSHWTPPLLKGVVQEGTISYRAGLLIKDAINIDNLCTCRQSREWGTLCIHSISIGLHHLAREKAGTEPGPPKAPPSARPLIAKAVRPMPIQWVREGEQGVELELFVVFPPNFEQAIARGRTMLCLEARTPRGRAPLNALNHSARYSASAQDRALLERAHSLGDGGDLPALLQLDASQLADLLPLLKEHPGLTFGRSTPLSVGSAPWSVAIRVRLEDDGKLRLEKDAAAVAPLVLAGRGNSLWGYANAVFRPLAVPFPWKDVLVRPVQISRSEVPVFLSAHWPAWAEHGARAENFAVTDFRVDTLIPRVSLHLSGGLAQLAAQIQATYGTRVIPLGVASAESDPWMPDPSDIRRYWTRNPSAEQEAMARLIRHGFTGPDAQGQWELRGQNTVLSFMAREFPRMQREWDVTLEERLERSCESNLERLEPQFAVTPSGVQWLDFTVSYRLSSGETLPAAEVQRLLLSGQSHGRLRNGKTAVFDVEKLEDFQEALRDCNPQQQGSTMRIAASQSGFLEATVRQHGWQLNAPAEWRETVRRQSGELAAACPPLGTLESVVRPYQRQGVAWFHFLRENRFGGILADEMGLGKTLQTLAFLTTLRGPGVRVKPHLVVCPTSLVFNWVHEVGKFAPELRTVALHGAQRHSEWSDVASADLVITSYSLIRRDAGRYAGLEFDTVILDEAQHIKNRETQNAQAVKAIRSQHRLVLTGTPLENSVFDLWSIFDFLMPGYLGSAQEFRDRYEVPISRSRDEGALSRLSRRLRPFILRRLKKDVAAELPAKLEQVAYCELGDAQRAVYQQILEAGRREMLDAGQGAGLARSRMVVLTTLLRLRQVACDLRLLKLSDDAPAGSSGKLEMFLELLEEVLDGGHRVLVFSQFTGMLALLRAELETRQLDYCYLDGSTSNRGEVVARFQGEAVPVFLISLKAGGVGLNLTAADTVIHFDPWWNPAVEDQATDRAHRIGQTRVVTGYKLIARDTVEEKILLLQQRKRELTAGALDGEEGFASALTWEEMKELMG